MKNRTYNILFHTHTVSGIVISVVLYVIFFAGSFSYFRDEIVNWERNHSVKITDDMQLDYNKTLDSLNANYNLYGRDIELTKFYVEQQIGVSLSASKDTLNSENNTTDFFYLDTKEYSKHSYAETYSLGEFLYRLHFLAQVPYPIGYYLSGFIALFFLFAIITGILVHWKKIISNFYVFRPLAKLKTLWTDAHTVLGTIGLPFQFIYAVTGAFFMLKILLVAPNIAVLYDGDQTKFYDDLEYTHPHYDFKNSALETDFDFESYILKTKSMWKEFNISQIHIFNYGDQNMHLLIEGHLNYKNKFTGVGEVIYNIETGKIIHQKNPTEKTSYLDGVKNILYRIHFADYGGYALKFISFLLGIITCIVIISGVMIWLVARDKKNVPEKKRRFNEAVVRVYLAVCLSMYPITALTFIVVKVVDNVNQSLIYNVYFIGWLLLTLFFILKKNIDFTNKYTLLLGSVLGFLIPVANGIKTNNWIWSSFINQEFNILFVDIFWIFLSTITLFVFFKLKKRDTK